MLAFNRVEITLALDLAGQRATCLPALGAQES